MGEHEVLGYTDLYVAAALEEQICVSLMVLPSFQALFRLLLLVAQRVEEFNGLFLLLITMVMLVGQW
jgi:hypothetical protein